MVHRTLLWIMVVIVIVISTQVLLAQKHLGCIGFVTHTYGYNV